MKLSPLTLYVIGFFVVFAAAMVSLSMFLPNIEEAKNYNEHANLYIDEAMKQPQANKKVELAIAEVNKMGAEWQQVVAVKTPPNHLPNGINLNVNRWQLTNDSVIFRNSMQRAVNAQMKRGGVKVITGPSIPPPPNTAGKIVEYYNYPAIKFPVLIFDLGQVTVQGSTSQIMQNMRAWSNMPNYLAVADGLQLSGTSPTMTGRYNVTIVAYIRGDKISGPVPEGGTTTTGQGGGGGPANNAPAGGGGGGGMLTGSKVDNTRRR